MKDYKTILQETLENLEKARITHDDFLLNNAEIEHLLDYIGSLKQENEHLDTVNCQLRRTIGQLRDNHKIKRVEKNENMSKKYYAVYPGQIKIDDEVFFGIDYKITDFVNELMEQNKKQKDVIDKIKETCASVPEDWTICGVEKIYEIEEALKEVSE